jgi:hypothetical protein
MSTKMAFPSPPPNERAAEVTAKVDGEIKRLEGQTRGLTEEIKQLEEDMKRQEFQNATPSGSRKANRRCLSYKMGETSENMAR